MAIDLSQAQIKKVIFHEVVKHYVGKPLDPILSDIECALDDDLKSFLRERLVATIGGDSSFEINYLKKTDSPIRGLLAKIWKKEEDFVQSSKEIVAYLNKIQTGKNPGGLVAIIYGFVKVKSSHKKFSSIFKLEKEEGARLEQSGAKGKRTFNLQHLRDLIFTAKTKVYKVGGFFEDGRESFGSDGILCDNQLSPNSTSGVATFFLTDFLGCKLVSEPKAQTKQFFEASHAYFNQKVKNGSKRAEYAMHLASYIMNQSRTIEPNRFATQCLLLEHRQGFQEFLDSAGLKSTNILKDDQFIKAKLKKTVLEFESGLKITGSPEAMKKNMNLKDLERGVTQATIQDKLKSV